MIFRRMLPEEKEIVINIAKSTDNSDIRSFPNYWTRFKNWESNPPFVLIKDNEIIGFTGMTFQKTGIYVNFYAFAISPKHQRKGYGKIIWDFTLKEASNQGKTRIKLGANVKKSGYIFFKKLGWQPIAKKKNEYKFDANIKDITSIENFIIKVSKGPDEPPQKELLKYLQMDECYLKGKQQWF